MATKIPLKNLVPTLCKYIKDNKGRLEHSKRLQDIFEGQLLTYLVELLKSELSDRAFKRMLPRVVPINVLKRIVDKLSKIYSSPVDRRFLTPIDAEISEKCLDISNINTVFTMSNKLYNLHQYFAVEPYFHDGKLKVRVLDPSQFLAFSDDHVSKEMTVFLKYMGELENKAQLWYAYSDSEFWAFDTEGKDHTEYLNGNEGVNPLGVIPFVYVSQYQSKLMPTLDTDIYEMTLRIPQLLSDLNYAHKFQAHSMVFGIDLDLDPSTEIDGNPDGFSLFTSKEGDGKAGRIDFLKPQVEIEASLKLIISELSLWLETRGIKAGSIGQPDASLSGISKILDEMDTTQARQEQIEVFSNMESQFWKLYSVFHNYHLTLLDGESKGMTLDPLKSISFSEQKPLEDEKSKIEKIKMKLDAGLTSRKRAIAEANPTLSGDEINELIQEIDEENTDNITSRNTSELQAIEPPAGE